MPPNKVKPSLALDASTVQIMPKSKQNPVTIPPNKGNSSLAVDASTNQIMSKSKQNPTSLALDASTDEIMPKSKKNPTSLALDASTDEIMSKSKQNPTSLALDASTDEIMPKSKQNPTPPRIKATSYVNWKSIKRLNSCNSNYLDMLDFSDFIKKNGVHALDDLFPKNAGCGWLDPPPEYLTTGGKVKEWRAFSKNKQEYEIEKMQKQQRTKAAAQSRFRNLTDRATRRVEQSTQIAHHDIKKVQKQQEKNAEARSGSRNQAANNLSEIEQSGKISQSEKNQQQKKCLPKHKGEIYANGSTERKRKRYDGPYKISKGIGVLYTKEWETHFKRLEQVSIANGGDANILIDSEHYDATLYDWAAAQRQEYKEGLLKNDKAVRLKSIGLDFDWTPRIAFIRSRTTRMNANNDDKWDVKFEEFTKYQTENGEDPPSQMKGLGSWCELQRWYHHKGDLAFDRMGRLRDAGFDFTISKEQVKQLEQQKFAAALFQSSIDGDDASNGAEPNVKRKIQSTTAKKITAVQENAHWEKHCNAVDTYIQQHGHPPLTREENPSLYDWLQTQKGRQARVESWFKSVKK